MNNNLKFKDIVLVRDNTNNHWEASIFSRYNLENSSVFPYICFDGCTYKYCIPYVGNEQLLGTTKANKSLEQENTLLDELFSQKHQINLDIVRLDKFIQCSKIYKTLDSRSKLLIQDQKYHMQKYSDILKERIDALRKKYTINKKNK